MSVEVSTAMRAPDAARYLGISASTLAKMRLSGAGPIYLKIGSRVVAYAKPDLDRWLEGRRRTSTSQQ